MTKPEYTVAHILHNGMVMGGTEHATLRIAESTRQFGFRPVAFCPADESETTVRDQFEAAGIETVEYSKIEPSYRRLPGYLHGSIDLAREFKNRNVDLIHCCDLLAAYYAGLAGRLTGLPVLSHIRCIFSNISRRDKSFLYAVNRFVFVSQNTWRQFAFQVPESKGTVIYDGIEIGPTDTREAREQICKQFEIPTDVQIIGMVARVAAAKDFETLIRAASEVIAVEEKVRFLIIGDHCENEIHKRHFAVVKDLLVKYEVEPYFVFAGDQTDVAQFNQAMDVFVLSTHSEGLPLVILEAMAMGKPVVATNVGGIPEIVGHGKTGFLHDHGDHKEFARQMLSLLQDPELSARFGAAGRQEISTKWTRERFAADVVTVYREMLGVKD